MLKADIAIIGAGIAGAGLAAMIGRDAEVIILEMEDLPGYHTTGRSAAFYAETYGGKGVQPLTTASRAFFENPPAIMADRPLLGPRGAIHLADADGLSLLDRMDELFGASGVALDPLDRADIEMRLPLIGEQWRAARYEPGCKDMDVAAIHQGFLRMAQQAGAHVLCNAALLSARRAGGRWSLETAAGAVDVSVVVIAAGAWADQVATCLGVYPVGITPFRRTMIQAEILPVFSRAMPLVLDVAGRFYFRPEGGGVWLTPHDETPDVPGDVQAHEIDVAHGVERFEKAGRWQVRRITRRWAGLRSFAPDRLPVYGFDRAGRGVFWCAGQGGFGIQTSPAASSLAAGLLLGRRPSEDVAHIDPLLYSPCRFG